MLLKKLPEKLGDPGKFLIPCDFPGMDVCLRIGPDLGTYSSTYDDMSINRIDVIDVACEEYSQEVLGFSNNSSGGNPTTTFEPIISDSFLSFTPFKESDFILEEIEAFLKDDSISPEIDHADCDPEGDICLIEKLLNNDPFQLPPMDLKEVTKAKSSIEEPPELELKDLPSHLEYAYLEGTDKLPVIIAKGLKNDEKEALLKVLKSHKRAIAWKITDIKGIDPRFCTHKILMEEDYKPTVQSQRRVNPKIHEVIKKEVIKLLDAGMIYPISGQAMLSPSLVSFETSDSLLEEFADELALLDPFPTGNEDVDFEADLREIEWLLNHDRSTYFSPKITIDPNPERFTNEPALVCLPSPGDDDDDESFLKKDIQEVNFRIYSNPLFEFDDNYNSGDINPLFKEILEDVESNDSNVSNFDEPVILNTPLFDEDECFGPGGDIDEINAFLDDYKDSGEDVLEILHNTTHNLSPEVFFDHKPQCFKDELLLTYPINFIFSLGSEDTIFDPGISAFHFSSLEPVAFESQMEICSST
ncbi:hypothetical protein Tco_0189164 [Tanacetum coccineum]